MARAIPGSKAIDIGGDAPPYLRWFRTAAIGFSFAFLAVATMGFIAYRFWMTGSDYVSLWAAGKLALAGQQNLAYDITSHHAAEQWAGHVAGIIPFPYPPPFLAIFAGFALLPFGLSYFAWVGSTAAIYAAAARRLVPFPFVFAMPAAYLNWLTGQTTFLMAGILIGGLSLVETSPWWAGAILGLMVLKPQLALLLPVAMLAGREWRVIAGAILSASALLLFGLILFGWGSYAAFFAILPQYVNNLQHSFWPWYMIASPFALARFLGVSQPAALWVHGVIAVAATMMTARAWWLKVDARIPILVTATLLVSPYLFNYDTLLMVVPATWLICRGRRPFVAALAWLLCFTSLLNYSESAHVWPNLIPAAALLCLWTLDRDSRAAGRVIQPTPADPAEAVTA
jgi:hypothetical protein